MADDGNASSLPDSAEIRLVPPQPPLDAAAWAALSAALERRFALFTAQGRIRAHALALLAGGAVVLMAWEGAEPLSGCSRDAVSRDLLAAEEGGQCLISAPPLVVEVAGIPQVVDRSRLRVLIQDGLVTGASILYDLNLVQLGAWRQHGRQRLDASTLGQSLLRRHVQG